MPGRDYICQLACCKFTLFFFSSFLISLFLCLCCKQFLLYPISNRHSILKWHLNSSHCSLSVRLFFLSTMSICAITAQTLSRQLWLCFGIMLCWFRFHILSKCVISKSASESTAWLQRINHYCLHFLFCCSNVSDCIRTCMVFLHHAQAVINQHSLSRPVFYCALQLGQRSILSNACFAKVVISFSFLACIWIGVRVSDWFWLRTSCVNTELWNPGLSARRLLVFKGKSLCLAIDTGEWCVLIETR